MVMVEKVDGKLTLVDENGKPIEEGANPLESAIFQVKPTEKLSWSSTYNNANMFREDTPQQVQDSIRKQYKAWRKDILENLDDLSEVHEIGASFGHPEDVTIETLDDKGNTITIPDVTARIPVTKSRLVSDEDIENTPLIVIPKTNEHVEIGLSTFKSALGTLFMRVGNGGVRLKKRHNKLKLLLSS